MPNETFSAFCNRVQMAGKTCPFCECTKGCRAEEYAIGDQIVIGTKSDTKKFHPCGMRFAVGHVKQYKAIYAKCSNC